MHNIGAHSRVRPSLTRLFGGSFVSSFYLYETRNFFVLATKSPLGVLDFADR